MGWVAQRVMSAGTPEVALLAPDAPLAPEAPLAPDDDTLTNPATVAPAIDVVGAELELEAELLSGTNGMVKVLAPSVSLTITPSVTVGLEGLAIKELVIVLAELLAEGEALLEADGEALALAPEDIELIADGRNSVSATIS